LDANNQTQDMNTPTWHTTQPKKIGIFDKIQTLAIVENKERIPFTPLLLMVKTSRTKQGATAPLVNVHVKISWFVGTGDAGGS
jgi:hypothetical protein